MKKLLVLTSTLLGLVSACTKEQGSEGGPCFPNATCNEGLACISELCVNEQRPSTATRVSALTTVDECPNGGQKIDTGIDDNLNGELDDDEVDESVIVCNGANGSNGSDGQSCTVADGPGIGETTVTCGISSVIIRDGDDGAAGQDCIVVDGPNAGEHTVTCGSTSVVIADGAQGASGASCSIANGPNAGEHTVTCGSTSVVLQDGSDGSPGAPGANCTVANGPNAGEHTVTCGTTAVVIIDGAQGAPGANCSVTNGPNLGEHTVTCGTSSVVLRDGSSGGSGPVGLASLIRLEPELGGPRCSFSGTHVLVGLDDNRNGTLEGAVLGDGEVDDEAVICSSSIGPCFAGYHRNLDGSCSNIAQNCGAILARDPLAADGSYLIDPDGADGPIEPFNTLCDMTGDGGGWTLIGKGREDWRWLPEGEGNVTDLTDTSATNVVYLASPVVQAIAGISDRFPIDGIRIIRRSGIDDRWFVFPTALIGFTWSVFNGVNPSLPSECRDGTEIVATTARWTNGVVDGISTSTDTWNLGTGVTEDDCSRLWTLHDPGASCIAGWATGAGCIGDNTCFQVNNFTRCIPQTTVWVRD